MNAEIDYYKTLGIAENATADEITKTFRKLAKKFHPDVHPGDKKAEAKFKEISEAYEILSDKKKRAEYDNLRKYGAGQGFSNTGYSPNDFYRQGGQPNVNYTGNVEDLFGGNMQDILSGVFGGGRRRANSTKGQDISVEVLVPFKLMVSGGTLPISMNFPDGKPRNIEIPIHAGLEDGEEFVLTGLGAQSPKGGRPGDLFVRANIQKDKFFRREGDNILADIHINLRQALTGAKARVRTPLGEKIELTIPPGTQPLAKLRVRAKGIKAIGDFIITVYVDLPTNLSENAKKKFDEFAKEAEL
jgi:molecular chaperone DnaJ